MSFLKKISKALQYLFKGPSGNVHKRVKTSTTHTRFKSAPGKPKKVVLKAVKTKKRSAKKSPLLEKKPQEKPKPKPLAKKLKPEKLPKPVKVKAPKPLPPEFFVGDITHFFSKISVVVVKVVDHPILVGDQIHIKGSADFTQKVESLQVESKDVRFARRGELVGLKTLHPAKPGDKVYKFKGK